MIQSATADTCAGWNQVCYPAIPPCNDSSHRCFRSLLRGWGSKNRPAELICLHCRGAIQGSSRWIVRRSFRSPIGAPAEQCAQGMTQKKLLTIRFDGLFFRVILQKRIASGKWLFRPAFSQNFSLLQNSLNGVFLKTRRVIEFSKNPLYKNSHSSTR